MSELQNTADYGRFDELAEEFVERFRRGERPSLQEYVDRCPEMQDAILKLFPALVEVEQVDQALDPAETAPRSRVRLDRLADFRIVGEIGRGGMGIVYEAEQISLGRTVALKVLPATMKRDSRSLERFRREARSAAQLHHTNIVPVFEVGEEGDSVYYAMQFIRGQGLNLVIEELRRLHDQSDAVAGPADLPVEATSADTGSIAVAFSVDRVAQSLLRDGFVNAPSEAGKGGRPPPRFGKPDPSTEGFTGVSSVPAARPGSASTPSSAVWPGGGSISMSETPGRRQPFFRSVAEIGRQVAGGLAYAHARGIIHRDIKPANLLLDTAGVAWIADFGLAKSTDESLTQTGDILGTLRFMAPERFRGEGDGRADIYALGVTLYELLTLRPAFDSPDRLRLIEQVRSVEPPRPRSIDPAIPRDLETVVLKAMAKDASARYAVASEMSEDLRRFLAGEAIKARRTSHLERVWRWSRRNPLAAGLAAAVALMALVVVVATKISADREHTMRIEADLARGDAERSLIQLREARTDEATFRRAIALERENLRKDPTNREVQGSLDALYSQQGALQRRTGRKADAVATALTRRDLNSGEPNRLYQVAMELADCLPRPGEASGPGDLGEDQAEQAASLAIETIGRAVLAGFRTDEYNLGFTINSNVHFRPLHANPDFDSLLQGVGQTKLPQGNGQVRSLLGHQGIIESVAITPDGKRAMTVGTDKTARLWDLATGKEAFPALSHPGILKGLAISADGRLAVIGCDDGLIYLWNLDDGSKIGTLDGKGGRVHELGLTSDGKTLVSGGHDGFLRVWDLEKRVERSRLPGHQGQIIGLDLSPDGRRAVTTGEDETVRVWDIEAGRPLFEPMTGHHGRVWSVAVMPDGRRALSGAEDGCMIEWDIIEGRRLRTLWGQWATIRGIAISPGGRRALTGGPRNRLLYWDLESGRELHRFPGDFGGGMTGVAISPDGRVAVTVGTDNVARVLSLSEDAASARDMAAVGRWGDALEAYGRAVAANPDDETLIRKKAAIAWQLGRWSDLVRDHENLRRLSPSDPLIGLNYARVLLMTGDREGYRRLCKSLPGMIVGKSLSQREVWRLILAGSLGDGSVIDPSELIHLANTGAPPYWLAPVRGLAQYRTGLHEETIATVLPVALEHPDWLNVSVTWPILAMAYHKLGDHAEARKWLEKSRALRDQKSPAFGRDIVKWAGPWPGIVDWIDFELLSREAEGLIGR